MTGLDLPGSDLPGSYVWLGEDVAVGAGDGGGGGGGSMLFIDVNGDLVSPAVGEFGFAGGLLYWDPSGASPGESVDMVADAGQIFFEED